MPTKTNPDAHAWRAWLQAQSQKNPDPMLREYYRRSIFDPDSTIADTPLVALDLETSGLDPRRDLILSIGLVPFDLNQIHFAARQQWLLRPPRNYANESVAYHHITHTEASKAPRFESIVADLLDAIAGRLVVVHYHPIERGFLERAILGISDAQLRFPLIDTMALEARRHRRGWRKRIRALMGQTPVSIRLHDSRARYGLPNYEGHRAVLDALAGAELFQAQIQHHYTRSTPISDLWL